jgi:diaminopimelate decarboxylase
LINLSIRFSFFFLLLSSHPLPFCRLLLLLTPYPLPLFSSSQKIPSARVGIRLNPQVGAGKIQAMSTATKSSKFGVPLEDEGSEAAVLAVYAKYPWLNGVHLHVGSQGILLFLFYWCLFSLFIFSLFFLLLSPSASSGCPLDLIAAGISRVLVLVDKANSARGSQQITSIDIGGGLPVNFDSEVVTPTFADYAAFLKVKIKTPKGRKK